MVAWFNKKAKIFALVGVLVCLGCGTTQVKPKTRTIVFTQGDVVTAELNRAEKTGRKVGPWTLPPLPVKLHETSEAFQQGFKEALSAIERSGPQVPSDLGPEAFDVWLKSDFENWLSESVQIVKRCRELLEKVAQGPAHEAIVAAALVGLIDQHYDELLDQIPIPPKLRGDQELIDIYRQELDRIRLPWLKKSITALVHCVSESSRQNTPLYGQWKGFCAEHAYALDKSHHGIKKRVELAEKLAREEAERVSRYGIRPEGPPICWQPCIGQGPLEHADKNPDQGPLEQADKNPEETEDQKTQTATTEGNLSPRDAYYGEVDPKTAVRVSIQSGDNDQVSPAPLHGQRVRKHLAACFSKNFKQAQQVTAAVQIILSLSKKGRVDEVDFKTVDPTAAAYLEPKFKTCLRNALKTLRFSRIASGQGALINAIVCMRRTAHEKILQTETEAPADAGVQSDSTTQKRQQ